MKRARRRRGMLCRAEVVDTSSASGNLSRIEASLKMLEMLPNEIGHELQFSTRHRQLQLHFLNTLRMIYSLAKTTTTEDICARAKLSYSNTPCTLELEALSASS
jgi:hypothetical protein